MNWEQLLNQDRLIAPNKTKRSTPQNQREDFERDFSRILYSNAFRRLHNKTQVFPMPENDHVHSRLTHSLEAADVGRTLGKMVGADLIAKYTTLKNSYTPWHFGFIVASACLAHDIGNPPFGHAGEDTISEFFKSQDSEQYLAKLNPNEIFDLKHFEGNAQGFRILCRISDRYENGGMQLTLSTLATFAKYPQTSDNIDKDCKCVSRKKYSFFQNDANLFATVATNLNLIERKRNCWSRHPLAFLTEAADDICYHILDLEDGCLLNLLSFDEYKELIQPIAEVPSEKLSECNRNREKITLMRAYCITKLVMEVRELFREKEEDTLSAKFDQSLTDCIKSNKQLRTIKNFSFEKCYRASDVVKIELAGYEVIHCILKHFLKAVLGGKCKEISLIREHFGDPYTFGLFDKCTSDYEKILKVVDIVSNMTDRYAVSLYRHLKGITLVSYR